MSDDSYQRHNYWTQKIANACDEGQQQAEWHAYQMSGKTALESKLIEREQCLDLHKRLLLDATEKIIKLREALGWYADASNWETRSGKINLAPVWADLGTTAHAALEGFCQRHNLLPGIGGRCDACEALK